MIAHVSIPAKDPKQTSLLLAALMKGEAFPFPVVPGAWIAIANDGLGTAVEVYPNGMAHHAGEGEPDAAMQPSGPATLPWEDQIYPDGEQLRPSAFHFAMTSPLGEAEVMELGRSAGLRTVRCERGGVFALVEIWLDDTLLVEVLTEGEPGRYAAFMNSEAVARMFGPGVKAV